MARRPSAGVVATLPGLIAPELAALVSRPPDAPEWLHEIKLDGYRAMARIEGGKVRMLKAGYIRRHCRENGGKAALEAFLDHVLPSGCKPQCNKL